MSNYHFEKWLYKTILGFLLITGGIFFMYYALTHFYRDKLDHIWIDLFIVALVLAHSF